MHSNMRILSCCKNSTYYGLLPVLHDDPEECDVSYRQLKYCGLFGLFF